MFYRRGFTFYATQRTVDDVSVVTDFNCEVVVVALQLWEYGLKPRLLFWDLEQAGTDHRLLCCHKITAPVILAFGNTSFELPPKDDNNYIHRVLYRLLLQLPPSPTC